MYLEKLKEILLPENILFNEPMSKHTTFRVGGNADVFVTPKTCEEIVEVVKVLKDENIKYFIIGKGSNLLVRDEGFKGVIIKIATNFNKINLIDNDKIYVEAGCSFRKLSKFAFDNELEGLEFAYGIPGTVGGAISMNAGAYGGEVKDTIVYATILDEYGNVKKLNNEELKLDYRKSIINERDIIFLNAEFKLKKGDMNSIKSKMEQFAFKRKSSQPIDKPSAGSTFKRPLDNFAGKLIEDSGLKGYKIGGAMVSTKHCGFIINEDSATSNDILELIEKVQEIVFKKYKVKLELEVKII